MRANFRGNGGRQPTTVGVRKLEALWQVCAITWRCLRDPAFSRFDAIPACDRQTHTEIHRHTTTANTRA